MKHEEFSSTRVGPYLWDIDVEAMEIDELRALEQLCRDKRQQKETEQYYQKQLRALLEEAADCDVQLCISDEDLYVNLTVMRKNIYAQEKEYWVK